MTDEEKFRFDLQGFLLVEQVRSPAECRELSDLANEAWPEQPEDGLIRARGAASLSRGVGSGGPPGRSGSRPDHERGGFSSISLRALM